MNAINKWVVGMFVVGVFSLLSFAALAEGIDDITNYQAPPPKVVIVQPYTLDEIIAILPDYLEDRGHLDVFEAPKILAFNEENFGTCKDFYILQDAYSGEGREAFIYVLDFISLPATKAGSAEGFKRSFEALKNRSTCPNQSEQYLVKLNAIVNAVVKTLPGAVAEKRRVEAAKVEVKRLAAEAAAQQEEVARQAAILEQQKVNAEREAKLLTERQSREAREKALRTCQAGDSYKLFTTADVIVNWEERVRVATLRIQQEREAGRISGYVNKQLIYELGKRITEINGLIKQVFVSYKNLGGTAKTANAVKKLPDPCAQ